MNIDFHYHATYLIAVKAGYLPAEAAIIATSSQMVDDNVNEYRLNEGSDVEYHNYISQTIDILKPKKKLLRIYPLFHFIPGDCYSESSRRKDGKLHLLNTTPNNSNALTLLRQAKSTNCLYKLGIACHVYADTWAHANFVGYYEAFNSMSGMLEAVTPDIGHADAKTIPDEIGAVWKDPRLMNEERDNNNLFLEASQYMFYELGGKEEDLSELLFHLNAAFNVQEIDDRIRYMKQLSTMPGYKGVKMPEYSDKLWFCRATVSRGWFFHSYERGESFEDSDWFKFQESIKWFQNSAWDLLKDSVFSKMDLKEL